MLHRSIRLSKGRNNTKRKRGLHILEEEGEESFVRITDCSNLVGIYSGWYPPPNMYRQIAGDLNYSLDYERDATHDYYVTSKHWSRRLQGYLKRNPGFAVRFLWRLFIQDPRYFFQAFLFWYYDPWTWQFRGEHRSPMRHLWLMFRSPEKPS